MNGKTVFAAVLVLCPDLIMATPAGYSNLSWINSAFGFLLCKYSMRMCVMITMMILNMKKRSHRSASLKDDDCGKELIKDDKREAKTKNPVMAPINLLLKSFISMKSVRYTRNQRTNVWRNVVMKNEVQILFNFISKLKLLPVDVISEFAYKSPIKKVVKVFDPL